MLDLYNRLPEIRITDLLPEVDDEIGFAEAFTHPRTGAPCKDRVGMLNELLAEGLNPGLCKMAEVTNTHDYFQLSRLPRWHVESEAMNLINAKYGREPGLKAYTHVSDQFGTFATHTIPATVNEAHYILDGLLMTDSGRKVTEQYADTGGFTDHVFAATGLLGFQFIPRVRDLPSKRLYLFDPASCPKELKDLFGGKVRVPAISSNWLDIQRSAATKVSSAMPQTSCCENSLPIPGSTSLQSRCAKSTGRMDAVLHRLAAGRGYATSCSNRPEQERSPSRPQECAAHCRQGQFTTEQLKGSISGWPG